MAKKDRVDLGPDPLLADCKSDSEETDPTLRPLFGFLGESDRPGFHRLYQSPALDEYYEVRDEDVVARKRLENDPSAQTILYVRRNASAIHVRTAIVDFQTQLLKGPLTQALLELAAMRNAIGWAPPVIEGQKADKNTGDGSWSCTIWIGCTDGKVAGKECTEYVTEATESNRFHITEDRAC